jgi:predicted dienelactone hydrolase
MLRMFLRYFLYIGLGVTLLVAGLVTYLVWFQPAFYFPKPTGFCAVGTQLYHLIDTQRKDIHSNDPAHPHQELLVKVWYPANSSSLPTSTPYAPDLFAHLKKTRPLASLLSGAFRHIYSYEIPNATIADDKPVYPVILLSPGGGGRYNSNSVQCQELASNGYIVVGISHPYDSMVMQFSDGRIKTPASDTMHNKSFMEIRKLTDKEVIEERVADVHFVLDQFEALAYNKESIFYKRLDLDHIGIFGQSLGGSAAVTMCRRDPRLKAGVDMDGSLFGHDATTRFDKPFMFMLAGESLNLVESPISAEKQKVFNVQTPQEDLMLKDRYLRGFQKIADEKRTMYIFVVNGAGHIDFNDQALLLKYAAPVFSRQLIKRAFVGRLGYGPIDGMRVTKVVNDYLVNFFNKYLKGEQSKLLDSSGKRYAEVETR